MISFDTEDDLVTGEDSIRISSDSLFGFYLGTYKYAEAGILKMLAQGLADRNIPVTFYVTPDFASNNTELIRIVEKFGHEIGVHLHNHNLREVVYPFYLNPQGIESDQLRNLSSDDKYILIRDAKQMVEKAINHNTNSFRSGMFSCDSVIEEISNKLGFTSISNHPTTQKLPSGIWQIGLEQSYDLTQRPKRILLTAVHNQKNRATTAIYGHPMFLYDHIKNKPRFEALQEILTAVDELQKRYPDLRFLTTQQYTSLLQYRQPGNVSIRIFFSLQCLLLITLTILLVWCCSREHAKFKERFCKILRTESQSVYPKPPMD